MQSLLNAYRGSFHLKREEFWLKPEFFLTPQGFLK